MVNSIGLPPTRASRDTSPRIYRGTAPDLPVPLITNVMGSDAREARDARAEALE